MSAAGENISLNGAFSSDITSKWFDQKTYEPLQFRKKKGAKHEFGHDIEGIIPEAAEVRLLGNRHKQCRFYSIGVEVCHT